VEAGTTLGLIHDFERIDADPWRAVTDVAGVVVAQAWRAHVRQGQHVAIVGRILPWRN
jgi:predicted deacylase